MANFLEHGKHDEIYPRVKQYFISGGRPITVAHIQRAFRLGCNRSLCLFEALVDDKVIERATPFRWRLTINTLDGASK